MVANKSSRNRRKFRARTDNSGGADENDHVFVLYTSKNRKIAKFNALHLNFSIKIAKSTEKMAAV